MAEKATIARPYARAAFEHAHASDTLAAWSELLLAASAAVDDPGIAAVLTSPQLSAEQLATLLADIAGVERAAGGRNFLTLLAENRRLDLLPEIAGQFGEYRAQLENVAEVTVVSAVELDGAQRARLETALHSRFGREVRMQCEVDPALLGGAVIRSGDLVIDGSLKSRLERLAAHLDNQA